MGRYRVRWPWVLFALLAVLGPLGAVPAKPGAPAAPTSPGVRLAEALGTARTLLGSPEAAQKIAALADGLEPYSGLSLLSEVAAKVDDPAQSKALLLRGGRLALLLGSFSTAADLFEAGAFRLPASRDDALLLSSARCRLAAGESDKAGDRAAIVARSAGNPSLVLGAALVAAWAKLLEGDATEAKRSARSLLEGPGKAANASAERREALFILWAASSGTERPAASAILAREYPGSPEAGLSQSPATASLLPTPHWYLSGALAAQEGGAEEDKVRLDQPLVAPPSSPSPPSTDPVQAAPGPAEDSGSQKFQVGIFSDAQNAALLVAQLGRQGITGKVEKRLVGGRELFAVIVEGESSATVLRLKDAGYEAWPLF